MEKNFISYLFVDENIFCNPNGDPASANHPRMDGEYVLCSSERKKREIRDYEYAAKGNDIFVRAVNGIWTTGAARMKDIPESTKEELAAIHLDTKWFGAVYTNLKKKGGKKKGEGDEGASGKDSSDGATITGPIQVRMGRSLHKAEVRREKGNAAFCTTESSKSKGFSEKYVVPYAVIAFDATYVPAVGKEVGMKAQDLLNFEESIWDATYFTNTSSKNKAPLFLLSVETKDGYMGLKNLSRFIKLVPNDGMDELSMRNTDDFVLDVSALAELLESHKDKVSALKLYLRPDVKLSQEIDGCQVIKKR